MVLDSGGGGSRRSRDSQQQRDDDRRDRGLQPGDDDEGGSDSGGGGGSNSGSGTRSGSSGGSFSDTPDEHVGRPPDDTGDSDGGSSGGSFDDSPDEHVGRPPDDTGDSGGGSSGGSFTDTPDEHVGRPPDDTGDSGGGSSGGSFDDRPDEHVGRPPDDRRSDRPPNLEPPEDDRQMGGSRGRGAREAVEDFVAETEGVDDPSMVTVDFIPGGRGRRYEISVREGARGWVARQQAAAESDEFAASDFTFQGGQVVLHEDTIRDQIAAANEDIDATDILHVDRGEGGEVGFELTPRARVAQTTEFSQGDIWGIERDADGGLTPILSDEAREARAREQAFREFRADPVSRARGPRFEETGPPIVGGERVTEGDLNVALPGQHGANVTLEDDFRGGGSQPDQVSEEALALLDGPPISVPEPAESDGPGGADFSRVFDAEHLTSNPSVGAQLFGTAERERAVEREAAQGSFPAQLFVGGEAFEQGGIEVSRWANEAIPNPDWLSEPTEAQVFVPGVADLRTVDVNPEVSLTGGDGGVRVGEQLRNVAVDAPTGIGMLMGLSPKALGDVGLRGQEVMGRDIEPAATPTASQTTAALSVAGTKVGEGIKEEPIGAAVEIAAPFTIGKVSPVRVRQFDVPEKAPEGAATSIPTSRQAGAAAELVRRGESPGRLSELDLDGSSPTPTRSVTGIRLEKPAVMQAIGTRSRGRTVLGFEGNRPTFGSPAADPNRVDLSRMGGRPGGTFEPNNPFETDVLQATARRQGGDAALRASAVENLIREASGDGVPGVGAVRRQATRTRQRVGAELDVVFGPLDRAAFDAGEAFGQRLGQLDDAASSTGQRVGQQVARGERAIDARLSPLDEAAFDAGVRTGDVLSTGGEVLGGAAARGGQIVSRPFEIADEFGGRAGRRAGRRIGRLEEGAFDAGEAFGQRLGQLDDAASSTGQRVGQQVGDVEDVFAASFGRIDDPAFAAGERFGQGLGRIDQGFDPLVQPLESAAFDAGEAFGQRLGDIDTRIGRDADALSAEQVVGDVRAVPEDATGAIVEALQDTEATIFGSAAAKAQVDDFRTPRDLDVIVPDKPAARQRFAQALEGSNADVGDVFDIKEVADAPGRAQAGEPIKFGRTSQEKLTTEEGIQVNPVQEELVRKAGASGFFREPGAAGTREFDVGPEPRRPGRTDVRQKDPQDASVLAEQLLGGDNPFVQEFNAAFGTGDTIPGPRSGGLFDELDFGFGDFATDQRGQAAFGAPVREDATVGARAFQGDTRDAGAATDTVFGGGGRTFDITPTAGRTASPSPSRVVGRSSSGARFRAFPAMDASPEASSPSGTTGGSPFGGFFGGQPDGDSPGPTGDTTDPDRTGGLFGTPSPPGGNDDGGNFFIVPGSPGDPTDGTPFTPVPGVPGSPPGGPPGGEGSRGVGVPLGSDHGGPEDETFERLPEGEQFRNPLASGAEFLFGSGFNGDNSGGNSGEFNPFGF